MDITETCDIYFRSGPVRAGERGITGVEGAGGGRGGGRRPPAYRGGIQARRVDQQDAGRHCQHPSLAHASAHSTVTTQTICLFPMAYVISDVAVFKPSSCQCPQ